MPTAAIVAQGKRFLADLIADEVPERSAALAYRFLFAIFPFAIFLAAMATFVAGWLGMGDPTEHILGSLGDNLPPDVAAQLEPQLRTVLGEARPGLVSIGALGALWAATGGVSSLINAMNRAYDVEETRGFVQKSAVALGLTLLASVGILAAFVTIVGGSLLTEQVATQLGVGPDAWRVITLARWPLVLALVAIAVAVLFRYGPNLRVGLRWTAIGGVVFAIGWLLATAAFALYVANFANYANTYGALGGVVVLMLWFYLTALMLLLAAEVTAFLVKQRDPAAVESGRRRASARRSPTGTGQAVPPAEPAEPAAPAAPQPGPGDRRRRGPAWEPAPIPIRRAHPAHQPPDGPPKPGFATAVVAAGVAAGAAIGLLAGRAAGPDRR